MQLATLRMAPAAPALIAPVHKHVALFQSWNGRFADSPQALAQDLASRNESMHPVFVRQDLDIDRVPRNAEVVRPGTTRYFRRLQRAGLVVTNMSLPGYFRKRRGVVYVQTWHGTPLKRIGFDIAAPRFQPREQFHRTLARDVANWDFLVSPNPFSTEIFRRAFRYSGPVLETGYPRNDVLVRAGNEQRIRTLRDRLRIPDHAKVALYMPTWRDRDLMHGGDSNVELRLSEQDFRALGDDWVLLVRAHSLVQFARGGQAGGTVRDVSDWPDPAELYVLADALITDYSSSMFDFAVTGKPMIFFAYDLEHYRDEVRGFYFDFEAEAPGPVVRRAEDVVGALADLSATAAEYESRYRAFAQRFCSLEDGHASARVWDAVLPTLSG